MAFVINNWQDLVLHLVMLCFAVLFIWFLVSRTRIYLKSLTDEKRHADFEKALIDKSYPIEKREAYFDGTIKLKKQIQIVVPIEGNCLEPILESVQAVVTENALGHVIRSYTLGDIHGIDVQLRDFVRGIEVLHKTLVEIEAPAGTLIEYSYGDIPIYE